MMEIQNDKYPKRVLQVIRHMNVGGAETFIMNMYRNINREKIQFDFLVFGPGYFDNEIKELGGNIFYMKYITAIGEKGFKKELVNFFETHKGYQVVHSHLDQVSGTVVEAANIAGVKYRISHSHSTRNSNGFIGKIYKKHLQHKINKNANVLFACGEDAARWLFTSNAKKAYVINNGVDIEKFMYSKENRNKIRKELGINDETKVVGHVGRFSKPKNHKFLVDIYKEYMKMNLDSKLVLIGDGELKQEIEEYVNASNLKDNVLFLGLRDDVYKIYSAMDIFLFPSLYEGLSIALIEAQISGLNIIGSDTIDKKTDISGNINWMSLKNNCSDWAKELNSIKSINREVLNDRIKEYDIRIVAKKMENRYMDMYKNII